MFLFEAVMAVNTMVVGSISIQLNKFSLIF